MGRWLADRGIYSLVRHHALHWGLCRPVVLPAALRPLAGAGANAVAAVDGCAIGLFFTLGFERPEYAQRHPCVQSVNCFGDPEGGLTVINQTARNLSALFYSHTNKEGK